MEFFVVVAGFLGEAVETSLELLRLTPILVCCYCCNRPRMSYLSQLVNLTFLEHIVASKYGIIK